LFSAIQLRQQRFIQQEALQVQMAQRALSLIELLIAIARIMVERPYLAPYVHDGKDLPEAPDGLRAGVLAYGRLFMNFGETVGWQIQVGQMSKEGALSWRLYFKDLCDSSPTVQCVLKRHRPLLARETLWLFGIGPSPEAVDKLGITEKDYAPSEPVPGS
jgi:hypothetical protein